MPVMLERWNDDRMDALDAKVDGLSGQLREQRQETREQRQEMKAGFERMYRLVIQCGGTIIVALIGLTRL